MTDTVTTNPQPVGRFTQHAAIERRRRATLLLALIALSAAFLIALLPVTASGQFDTGESLTVACPSGLSGSPIVLAFRQQHAASSESAATTADACSNEARARMLIAEFVASAGRSPPSA